MDGVLKAFEDHCGPGEPQQDFSTLPQVEGPDYGSGEVYSVLFSDRNLNSQAQAESPGKWRRVRLFNVLSGTFRSVL